MAPPSGPVPPTLVTLQATTPLANATNRPGMFTVSRVGDTNAALRVSYAIYGTASNGLDYAAISNWAIIPAGQVSHSITITPLVNPPSRPIKTVSLQLNFADQGWPTSMDYSIGGSSSATVYLTDQTNLVPGVNISSPAENAVFTAPADIPIFASAYDLDGFVRTVEFLEGTNRLGVFTNPPPAPPGSMMPDAIPHFVWTNAPAGEYVLTAVATDNGGATATSAPVHISVRSSPPPTNPPPAATILSPLNGEVFWTPMHVFIDAWAFDLGGAVASVQFFAGTNSLGFATPPPPVMPAIPVGVPGYTLTWTNPPPGVFALTAVVTDDGGASSTSAPVNIVVKAGPPPTNLPPVVEISSPANGEVLVAPTNLFIQAQAGDLDGRVTNVEYCAGGADLGTAHQEPLLPSQINPWYSWVLSWTNPPVGAYALTAVATDNGGLSTTSAPVNVTILPSPLPPPTNRSPVVSIVATDPVAVEGTNDWVWRGETNPSPTWADWPPARWRCFTNSGPKTATFMVRRFGDTNDALAVGYDIGGTASNGVDYVALPGTVTIPAGARHAPISVVPIDDDPPDVNKTVILRLTVPTNTPPEYSLGFPRHAGAIIIDRRGPRLGTGLMPGHAFHLSATGPESAWYCIQFSTNLVNWTSLCTNQVIDGAIDFVDPDVPKNAHRFYRVVPHSGPPRQ